MLKQLLVILNIILLVNIANSQEIEIITQEKIQGAVTLLAHSPNGQLIASADNSSNIIKIWDFNSGKIIGKLVGHDGRPTAFTFNASGTRVISADKNKQLIIWDIERWKIVDTLRVEHEIKSFALNKAKPMTFYYGDDTGQISEGVFFNLKSTNVIYSVNSEITNLTTSDKLLAASSKNGQVMIYDIEYNEFKQQEKIAFTSIQGLKFIENGAKLLTVTHGGKVQIFPVNNLTDGFSFNASTLPINAVDINNKREFIVVSNQTNGIKVYDFKGESIQSFKNAVSENENSQVEAISISPDGSTFAATGKLKTSNKKYEHTVKIWDIKRGTLFKEMYGEVNPIYSFDFHPTENKLITLGDDHTLTFWDFNLAEKYGSFQLVKPSRDLSGMVRPNDEELKVDEKVKKAKRFGDLIGDVINGDLSGISEAAKEQGKDIGVGLVKRAIKESSIIRFSPKGNYLITKLKQDEIRLYNIENGKPTAPQPLYSYQLSINQLQCSPDEKYLAVIGAGDSAISIMDLASKKILKKLYTPGPKANLNYLYEANSLAFSPDGKYLAVCFNTSKTYVFNTSNWSLVFENVLPDNLGYVQSPFVNFSKDGQFMVVKSMLGIVKYNTNTFDLLVSEELKINGYSVPLDKAEDYAITILDNQLYFENLFTKEIVKSIYVKPQDISNISINPKGMVGITFNSGQFKLINPETGVEDVLLVANGDNYIFKTSENYYKVSKEGYDLVTYRIGNQAYPFEQFDAIYNRPDLVLKSMGCTDTDLIDLYNRAYLKRIGKLNIKPNTTVSLTSIPNTLLMNAQDLPAITSASAVDVSFSLQDKTNLKSYNIWVNNVPLYGANGKLVTGKSKEITENVKLIHGLNKIQVSCQNSNGFESLIQTFYIEKSGDKPAQNLYLVTIGTADYKDDRYDLNYPVKDGQDLSSLMGTNRENIYANVYTKHLYDSEVTKENITKLSSFLSGAQPDDIVIVFIAGHGILDANFDYYFGTYAIDFTKPSLKGLAYAELEKVLEKTAANKKLLIMDTCHSGEVDKEEVFFSEDTPAEEEGDVSFRAVGAGVETKTENATPTRLANELFNDLRKGTGATVISSAGGAEFAMESDEWKNGLFTYCLLTGLKNRTADLDGNGTIMLVELQEYVVNKVSALSHGRQIPNSRIKNMELDFPIW